MTQGPQRQNYLPVDDIKMYCRIITALSKTIAIQEEIDDLYSEVEENILLFE